MYALPLAFGLGAQELLWIAIIVLVLFGGTKIPELMRGVGRGVGELQKGLDETKRTMHRAIGEENETTKSEPTPGA